MSHSARVLNACQESLNSNWSIPRSAWKRYSDNVSSPTRMTIAAESGTRRVGCCDSFGSAVNRNKSKAEKQEADRGIRLHRDAVRKDRGEKADIPEPAEQYQAAQEH